MEKKDYYGILGVSKTATQDEIKKAYKRLAKKYHPDRNAGDESAENRFKEISEAYHLLSDPEKRKQYDMFGRTGFQGDPGFWGGTGQGGGNRYTSWSPGPGSEGFDFRDLFSQIFGKGGRRQPRTEGFAGGNPFAGSGDPYDFAFDFDTGPQTGRDVEAHVTIRFEDAIEGGTHRITLQRQGHCSDCGGTGSKRDGRWTACSACDGTGRKKVSNAGTDFTVICNTCSGQGRLHTEPCTTCRGTGRSTGPETLSVKIPPGVDNGGRLRIPGKGEVGPDGRAGDLYLRIHVTPHRYFRREGKDLHLDLPVTVSEAVLGTRVEVPTLDGRATLKIPAGSQNGARLRMKGKGIQDPKGGARGDMYVHVQLVVPEAQDLKARKIFEALKETESNPRAGMF
jgi:molecular chaperone DnaJ